MEFSDEELMGSMEDVLPDTGSQFAALVPGQSQSGDSVEQERVWWEKISRVSEQFVAGNTTIAQTEGGSTHSVQN